MTIDTAKHKGEQLSQEQKTDGQTDASNASNQENQTQVRDPDAVLRKNQELLAKLKETQAKFQEMQEKLTTREQEELAAAGKKDELIDSLKKQLKEREDKLKVTVHSFAQKAVNQQVIETARTLGCEKPEAMLKLADLSSVTVNDDFSVDSDALKSAIERVREEIPALFKKQVSPPKDGTPGRGDFSGGDLKGKTIAELQELYKKAALKQT